MRGRGGGVSGVVVGADKRDLQRTDDVTSCRTGVIDTHEQSLLGLSTSVGDDP